MISNGSAIRGSEIVINCARTYTSGRGDQSQQGNGSASDKTTLRVHVRSTSKDTRPVNLDLGTIQLPVTAYASITHRVTGVLMFFASFLLLWALDRSLASEESFNALSALLGSALAKGVIWAVATVLTYHALAGIKHLIMDAGVGETMRGGVIGARAVFALATIGSLGWGLLLW